MAIPRRPADTEGAPRWVKVSGIIGGVLVLLFVVMLFTGHGPGRHMLHSSVTEQPVQQP